MEESLFRNLYKRIKVIKETEQKTIWLVKNASTEQQCIAKLQLSSETKKGRTILHEGKFLQQCQGYRGIPFLFWAGRDQKVNLSIIIMQKLGLSLRQLLDLSKDKRFSIKTVCMLGAQMIDLVQMFHEKGFTHGNLNLQSLQMGLGPKNTTLHFNDLMQSISIVKKTSQNNGKNQKIKPKNSNLGSKTPKKVTQFMSLSKLSGNENKINQDMFAVVMMMIYMIKGQLPWSELLENKKQGQKHSINKIKHHTLDEPTSAGTFTHHKKQQYTISKEETNEETLKFKTVIEPITTYTQELMLERLKLSLENTTNQEICRHIPKEFTSMLNYLKHFQDQDTLNYHYFRTMINKIMQTNGYQFDSIYDWMLNSQIYHKNKVHPEKNVHKIKKKFQFLEFANQKEILQNYYSPYQKFVELE